MHTAKNLTQRSSRLAFEGRLHVSLANICSGSKQYISFLLTADYNACTYSP